MGAARVFFLLLVGLSTLACDFVGPPTAEAPAVRESSALPEASAVTAPRRRVFLIGIDGASPLITRELIASGRLPNLAAIAESGASDEIVSARPIRSPRIWTSVATGKTPDGHGIKGFRTDDGKGRKRLYRSSDRRGHALWNMLSDRGLSVGVVNWWVTHPAERVKGIMISDHLIPAHLPGAEKSRGRLQGGDDSTSAIIPAEMRGRAIEAVVEPEIPVPFGDFLANAEGLPERIDRRKLSVHLRTDAAAARLALLVEDELEPDLLMVFLPGIDRVSHWLWFCIAPAELYPEALRPTPAERRAGAATLYRYYEYVDALIGRITDRADEDDLVVVLSDHGFEAGQVLGMPHLTGKHDTELSLTGILFARGPRIAPGTRTSGASINDVTPTLLAWLGLPHAEDMDGRVAAFLSEAASPQLASIPTYDGSPIERLTDSAEGEAELLEQLRALGYLE